MVKIVSLEINNLHGVFNYDVKFNTDVTFLYGSNGCGKTTILNITEAIITGQLYKLFQYNFKYIHLYYSLSGEKNNENLIKIKNENGELFKVTFNGEDYDFENYDIFNNKRIIRDAPRVYFKNYNFLNDIKKTFNYVYLPLNRYINYINENYHTEQEYYDVQTEIINKTYKHNIKLENSIREVKYLIEANFNKISRELSKCDNEFRNSVLTYLLGVNTSNTIQDCTSEIIEKKINIKNIEQIRNSYLKTLKLLNKSKEDNVKEDNVKDVEDFFNSFIKNYQHYQHIELEDLFFNNDKINILDLVAKYQEIKRTQKIVKIYDKTEVEKEKIFKPFELFLSTMRQFFKNDLYGKEIIIDENGHVKFKVDATNETLDIQYLSSGEKQILIFFANLIFNVESGKSGIFVVDEPELSLHLYWQKIFVEKALSLNSDLQLIFATHAPEIVGKYKDKMFKLEKKIGCE